MISKKCRHILLWFRCVFYNNSCWIAVQVYQIFLALLARFCLSFTYLLIGSTDSCKIFMTFLYYKVINFLSCFFFFTVNIFWIFLAFFITCFKLNNSKIWQYFSFWIFSVSKNFHFSFIIYTNLIFSSVFFFWLNSYLVLLIMTLECVEDINFLHPLLWEQFCQPDSVDYCNQLPHSSPFQFYLLSIHFLWFKLNDLFISLWYLESVLVF